MERGADRDALGAAVTVALCGDWDHDGPCPLAPHSTGAWRDGDVVHVRVLFATEPEREHEARYRIDAGLAAGCLTGPEGGTTRWRLQSSQPGVVSEEDADWARELIDQERSGGE